MTESKQQTSMFRVSALVLVGLLAVMIVIGSIWDQAISQSLHDGDNVFGIFFAAFGPLPATVVPAIAGVLVWPDRPIKGAGDWFSALSSVVLVAIGLALTTLIPRGYVDMPMALSIGIAVLTCGAAAWFAGWLGNEANRRDKVRVAVLIVVVALAQLLLVNVVKVVWDRPRLRLLAENTQAAFQAWWIIGNKGMLELIADGISAEEFKSFPSAHTSNAAAALLLVIVAPLKSALALRQVLLLWVGAVWGLVVGVSRLVTGAHFVSDITVGFAITFVMVLVARRFAPRPGALEAP